MRIVAAIVLCLFAGALAAAADKDEDKAKEATLAFLKALKAKDIDAVMKTVDVPFYIQGKEGMSIKSTDDLKSLMTTFLEKLKPEKVPTELGKVIDSAALRKLIESKKEDDKVLKEIDTVLGKTGYAVFLVRDDKERGAILVRLKDGKAAVVGIPR